MNNAVRILSGFFFVCLLFSCQKELSYEMGQNAAGSLQSATGECLPKTVGGTYSAAQVLADSNYIEVTVNVTQTGNYTITSDTLNGYWFNASGTFTALGSQLVRLQGVGTPTSEGIDNFNIFFDSTTCIVPVPVLPGSGTGGSAVYSLQGAGGDCLNSNVIGTYTVGTPVGSVNSVQLEVNVTTIGTWNLTTTQAGITFTGSGSFTATGVQTITLFGGGTPITEGQQTFTVTAGGGSCTFVVTVEPNTAPQASFGLEGDPNACINYTTAGTYTEGIPLGAGNTLTVQVNVTAIGQWAVSTNTVAGITFSGAGTFTATGVQPIVLTGSGTPTASGAQNFTVTSGATSCTAVVNVEPAGTPQGDHFPLTLNSWWSYDDGQNPGDTIKRTSIGTQVFAGNTYQEFEETDHVGDVNYSVFFRKDANDQYFEYTNVDAYSLMQFDDLVAGDIMFLKENLTTGEDWFTDVFTGTENGLPKSLRYHITCTESNGTYTINGVNYTDVHKIRMESQTSPGTATFTSEGVIWDFYFARNIGMIYFELNYQTLNLKFPIRNYEVF